MRNTKNEPTTCGMCAKEKINEKMCIRVCAGGVPANEPIARGIWSSFTGLANEQVHATVNEPIAHGIWSSFTG